MSDSLTNHIFKLALTILWSAGHEPTRAQRIEMLSRAWRHAPSAYSVEAMCEAACQLLRGFGYAPRSGVPADLALPAVTSLHRHSPAAGHAVRISRRWAGAEAGSTLRLSTTDRPGHFHIGGGRHHLTESGAISLSSGGPRSMLPLRVDVLGRTDETVRVGFWRFALSPEAGGGVDFTREVPLWTWDGDDAAFTRDLQESACL